jgi:hypothetical protein
LALLRWFGLRLARNRVPDGAEHIAAIVAAAARVRSLWEAFSRQDMEAATADFDESAEIPIPTPSPGEALMAAPRASRK